ncbi:hypothetical protein DF042_01225 [Burkholderia cenocepacia]|nr:hypothetical protein DF042_01225 [Burkholderia cenocepacia]
MTCRVARESGAAASHNVIQCPPKRKAFDAGVVAAIPVPRCNTAPHSRRRGETGYHRRETPRRPATTVTDASRQRHPPTP